jgi:hypothetical protein
MARPRPILSADLGGLYEAAAPRSPEGARRILCATAESRNPVKP